MAESQDDFTTSAAAVAAADAVPAIEETATGWCFNNVYN